jgi:hypothetical protein
MKKTVLLSLLLWFSATVLTAQSSASTSIARSADTVVPVTLGQSVVALNGPWKFRVGDDPRWADPSLDDSQWETVDLTPTLQTTLRGVPIPGFVSGWSARGHAEYAGYAWYRLRVRISGAAGPLTLLGPEWFDDAFQVFAKGRLIGSSGDFNRRVPVPDYTFPATFTLPASAYAPGTEGSTLIAFRFYMDAGSLGQIGTGGMHGPPRIGLPGAATAVWQLEWEKVYRRTASALAAAVLYFIFGLLVAMMFVFSPKDKILLWPLSACVLTVIHVALVFSTNAQWTSAVHMEEFIGFADRTSWALWLLTWWAYFGLQSKRWLFITIVALETVNVIAKEFFTIVLWTTAVSHAFPIAKSASDFIISHAELLVVGVIAWMGWKRVERGRWPLYVALLFYAIQGFIPELILLHLRISWMPFGVLIPLGLITACISLFFFSIVLFLQFRASLQRKQAMEDDVKQAHAIQRILIPKYLPKLSGWIIESEYRSALEVGGDFFQIIPHPSDGSLLVVAGDVAGKGLQAGMTVALLVGAIRTESEHTFDPVEILKRLNHRLMGQDRAQATCLAMLVKEDGEAMLANAGHLPPYLNGVEIGMEGSLPLGMITQTEFPVMVFNLQSDDRLVLMSDGIVEAQNERGELFGFDRIRALLSKPISTAEIANTAQAFGQQDDISVLSIARVPVIRARPIG